jgi:hypothetical protein
VQNTKKLKNQERQSAEHKEVEKQEKQSAEHKEVEKTGEAECRTQSG